MYVREKGENEFFKVASILPFLPSLREEAGQGQFFLLVYSWSRGLMGVSVKTLIHSQNITLTYHHTTTTTKLNFQDLLIENRYNDQIFH